MFCAPFCYIYDDPIQLYFTFRHVFIVLLGHGLKSKAKKSQRNFNKNISIPRAFYLQFSSKLHEVSSDPQGIVALCSLFENLVRIDYVTLFLFSNIIVLFRCFFMLGRSTATYFCTNSVLS